jgi:hypothetical protein
MEIVKKSGWAPRGFSRTAGSDARKWLGEGPVYDNPVSNRLIARRRHLRPIFSKKLKFLILGTILS